MLIKLFLDELSINAILLSQFLASSIVCDFFLKIIIIQMQMFRFLAYNPIFSIFNMLTEANF